MSKGTPTSDMQRPQVSNKSPILYGKSPVFYEKIPPYIASKEQWQVISSPLPVQKAPFPMV